MSRLSPAKVCNVYHGLLFGHDVKPQAGTDLSEPDVLPGFAASVKSRRAASLRTQDCKQTSHTWFADSIAC